MTRDDIRRMAKEAGLAEVRLSAGLEEMRTDMWQRFAELVAAVEREACAKVCGDYWDYLDIGEDDYQDGRGCAALDLQSAIRARNKPRKAKAEP